MENKKLLGSLLVFGLATTFAVTDTASAAPATKVADLKQMAKSQSVNILIYGENGEILEELASDGGDVVYEYQNGKMVSSKDEKGKMQKYKEAGDRIEITDLDNSGKVVQKRLTAKNDKPRTSPQTKRELVKEKLDKSSNPFSDLQFGIIAPDSTTVYENYYVNGVLMNDIANSSPNHGNLDYFINGAMTQADIQSFLTSKNSILKDSIQIWRKNSSGTVYNTNTTIVPAKAIYNAGVNQAMNPKVIIATLQKESSLVSATPGSVSYSSRRFYYAMGYGATDSGDINGTSGFDIQIDKGADLLNQGWVDAPYTQPVLFSNINYGRTVTSGSVTYKNYIWTKNWGTWSLYHYTPHALDVNLLPSIGGGNYLFQSIFKGYWGTNWS